MVLYGHIEHDINKDLFLKKIPLYICTFVTQSGKLKPTKIYPSPFLFKECRWSLVPFQEEVYSASGKVE